MKKYVVLSLICMALCMAASADVLPGPVPENQVFTTSSLIEGVGITTESTDLIWQLGDKGYDRPPVPVGNHDGVTSGSIMYSIYKDTITANGGQISEVKSFSLDTHEKTEGLYNIQTEKVLTYNTQSGSHLMGSEEYVLDVAGNWSYSLGDDMVCVFASTKNKGLIPAFCNKATASSKLRSITTAQVEAVGALTAVSTVNKENDRHTTPSALDYMISVTPDANSASGYADGIVSTTFTVSVMEGRTDGNFSPGLTEGMIKRPIVFNSGVTGLSTSGFTIDGGSFGPIQDGPDGNGRENTITFGSPDIADQCSPPAPGYSGKQVFRWEPSTLSPYVQGRWVGTGTYYPTRTECEEERVGLTHYNSYVEARNSLALEIVKDGVLVDFQDIKNAVLDGSTQEITTIDGIRIEYSGYAYQVKNDGNQGNTAPINPPSNEYVESFADSSDGSNGNHGSYTGPLKTTIYFDEQFGQIPPGSSLQMITNGDGEVLTFNLDIPGYGNGGVISGDPYLEHYDELAARVLAIDTAIVNGGISNFMKAFSYTSGVACEGC